MTSKDYPVREIEIDLQKYWLVLQRRWLPVLVLCGLTTVLGGVAARSQKPMYMAEAQLLFEPAQASSLVGLEDGSRELKALSSRDNPLDTQIQVFRSIPIAEQVIEKLQMKDSSGKLLEPEALLANLVVAGVPGTDVLQIAYRSSDRELAPKVVNTVMDAYIQNDIQINRAAAVAAQDFITAQLPVSETEVSVAESALRQFKEANSIVDLEVESSNTVEVLSGLNNSLTDLKANLADNAAQVTEMQGKLGMSSEEAYAVGLASESPGVQEVLKQLQEVQSKLAIALTRYEESHPEVVNIRSQEVALITLLEQRVGIALGDAQSDLPVDDLQSGELEQELILNFLKLEAEQSGLQQRVGELSSAQVAQQARAQSLPGLEKQHRELLRKLNAAQTTYESLLESRQQAQVLENQKVGNARVVSPARLPRSSEATPVLLYLLAGGFIGALLGVMLAFLLDFVDRSVKTVREGQRLYGYPLLGVIPAWKKLPPFGAKELAAPSILVREPQTVPLIESYQALQANLKFSCLDKPLKTLAVTSAIAGEGKSEVAANLALTLAHLGHLVLVIDADMRSPTQHHIWEIPGRQGLSNFVVGQAALKDVIVPKEPNLHILPVGVIPPNPLAILESKQMSALLHASEKIYDYIIIDTPSLIGLADTLTLGRITDGLLLVMQPRMANLDSIRATKSMLVQSQQKVLGIVANGINVNSQPDRYFYHNQEYIINKNQDSLLGLSSKLVGDTVNANGNVHSQR
jgi:polysaccharide biosynthesis transport protein